LLLICVDRAEEMHNFLRACWLQKPFTEQELLSRSAEHAQSE